MREVFALVMLLCALVGLPRPLWAKAESCDEEAKPGPAHTLKHTCPANNDVLYRLAQSCTRNLKSNPSCRARGPRRDYAIIKDNSSCKPKAYLLLPSQCVTGVESKAVLAEPVVDFWRAAWIWLRRELPEVPPSRLAVAVNSLGTRGNDQLHFHLACVAPDVRTALNENAGSIPNYSPAAQGLRLPLGPRQHSYEIVKVKSLAGKSSPFKVVERMHGEEQSEMAKQGITVVAAGKNDFYVLNTSEEDGGGHAEELLDQGCR
jgi:CDP-diacylglycerol pyrophosphatase